MWADDRLLPHLPTRPPLPIPYNYNHNNQLFSIVRRDEDNTKEVGRKLIHDCLSIFRYNHNVFAILVLIIGSYLDDVSWQMYHFISES